MKPQIWWGIKSGGALLPFTIRTTRKQAISDHLSNFRISGLRYFESVVKVRVTEIAIEKTSREE